MPVYVLFMALLLMVLAGAVGYAMGRSAATVGIFLLLGGNGGVVWASQFIPSSLAALLVATVPLWMVAIDSSSSRPAAPSSPGR